MPGEGLFVCRVLKSSCQTVTLIMLSPFFKKAFFLFGKKKKIKDTESLKKKRQ